ncbi:S8 family serine peptidase [Clostridiaceae bacterium M8S5]|nr:S8 family serine peptidase [Clostridiaceae bacterium M8S5]
MKKNHIVVIDDGVNERYFNTSLIHNLLVNDEMKLVKRKNDYNQDEMSHGTTCAGIIKKYAKHEVDLSSIKILSNKGDGKLDKLIIAMEWCIENKVDIINLSMGTVYYKDKKEASKIINKAVEKGITIIAANKNARVITYPSVFINVIGVKCDRTRKLQEGEYTYELEAEDGINITACSIHKMKNYLEEEPFIQNCNSFATPMITAIVSDYIANNSKADLKEIKKFLYNSSMGSEKNKYYESYIDLNWVKKPLIITDNKKIKPKFFHPVEIIEINKTQDKQKQILEIVRGRVEKIIDLDSIIIDIKDLTKKEKIEISKEICNLMKAPIIIEKQNSIKEVQIESNQPVYFNSTNIKLSIKKREEIPQIIIKGKNEEYILEVLNELGSYFKEDGYNPTIMTNSRYSLYYDFRNFDEKKVEHLENLEDVIELYNGDIGIIGVVTDDNSYYMMDEKLDFDVYILDKKDKLYEEYHQKMKREEKDMLVLELKKTEDIKSYAQKLFDTIVNFYDTEDNVIEA